MDRFLICVHKAYRTIRTNLLKNVPHHGNSLLTTETRRPER